MARIRMSTVMGLSRLLARVRSGPFDLGDDDYEAWTNPGSAAKRVLVARQGGHLAIVLAMYTFVLVVASPRAPTTRPYGVFLGTFALAAGVLLLSFAGRIPLAVMDLMSASSAVVLAIGGVLGGPFSVVLPAVYVLLGTALFTVRSLRVSMVHIGLMGASYGVVLAFGPPASAPFTRWLAVMAAVVSCGAFIRWLVSNIGTLVVAEHDARAAAEAAAAELAVVSRAKTAFLARMSHELRTPLNAILGFGSVLRDQLAGPLNPRQLEYVGYVSESGHHLLALVDEVLDLSKVESGTLALEPSRLDVREVIDDGLTMVKERAARNGVRLGAEVGRGATTVEADPRKLRQVLYNLLANAVKFTPSGGRITVRASRVGERIRISVEDTGVGIAPDDHERIFREFEQTTVATEGTGLGLPLARRYVELHGGRLWVESAPGAGSTFTFEVPRRSRGVTVRLAGAPQVAPPPEHEVYRTIAVAGSQENQALIKAAASRLAGTAGGLAIVFALVTPATGKARLVTGLVGAVALASAYLIKRFSAAVTPVRLEAIKIAATFSTTALALAARPYADLIALGYAWITLTPFALLDRRRAVSHVLLIAACYGVVVARDPADAHAAVRWLAIVLLLIVHGVLARWVITKLLRLATAERVARHTAEQVRLALTTTSQHKGAFLASMSHELRTPLNAIIGFSEVLHDGLAGPLNERQLEYVDDILDAGRHLLALINDILDLAKIEAGQLHVSDEAVSVPALVERALASAVVAARERSIDLTVDVAPDPVYVAGDHVRLEQVVSSVVGNAVKFTPDEGHVHVAASVEGGEVRLAVTDTGVGIDPTLHDAIFEAFAQGPTAREGTGLGLALARGLTELHGGRISVESRPDLGSTFTVALPVAAPATLHVEQEV